jgi:ABC-type nickel/cobalt efflux system permease component RcnA
MHKLFKTLTILAFVIGLFLFLSGDAAYFSKSGGTGLVILAIGTPLLAIMTTAFRNVGNNQSISAHERHSSTLFRNGLIMLIVGFLIYLSAFVGDQGFGSIGVAVLGAFVGFVGIITLLISAHKR